MVKTTVGQQIYGDRRAAGRALAEAVAAQRPAPPVLVLGLPRGGVPVAYEVARALHAPLDVLMVRKLGLPSQPELAIGAVASGGIVVHESAVERHFSVSPEVFQHLIEREQRELERREQLYRAGQPLLELHGKHVILVDDGIATGATMLAAVRAARRAGAISVMVAAPVASVEAVTTLEREADRIVVLQCPEFFYAIGQWYQRFEQLEDQTVCNLLAQARLP
jgi:predicted phosphoribosyltransferase